jgi:GT2 family glycosyltransferase
MVLPTLSFVIPCLNEARTIAACVTRARDYLAQSGLTGEIIVADNGSTDGSAALAINAGARVVLVAERGYGAALLGGILAAQHPLIIMGDADGSYDFAQSARLLAALQQGADLVVGNRFQGGIARGAMPWRNRYLGNPVLSFLGRLFFKIPLGDFHCGLRGFRREAVLGLNLRTTGMEFASELIVRAALAGLRLAEVPVTLAPDGRGRPSHLQPWRDGWRHLRFLLLYSPRWLYLYPGLAAIALGLAVALLLLPGPFMVSAHVGLDVHSLLAGMVALLLGVQSLSFAILARCYAVKQGILPPHPHDRWLAQLTVERLLLAAGGLLLAGGCGVAYAAQLWAAVHFGALDYRNVMRVMIAAATCLIAGLQIGCTGFLLGIFGITQRS